MAKLRSNNSTTTDKDGDFYTRTNTTVVKKGTPETKKLKYEAGTVQRKPAGGVEFKTSGTEERTADNRIIDPKSKKVEDKGQASLIKAGQDIYSGADLEKSGHKKGDILSIDSKGKKLAVGRVGEEITPATPDETVEKKQRSVTHKGDIQSSKGYPEKGKDLESKGYKNIPGTYNYEKPKKQVWVDEDQVDKYIADNPDAQASGPKLKEARATEAKKEAVEEKSKKKIFKYKKDVQ